MSDQSPHSPAPAYPPSGSREPDWTTGQGIGFLVALPGWIIVGLAALVGVIGLAAGTSGTAVGAGGLLIIVGMALFGTITAIPGTIVFNKCKRR
ncbi:MAG: hypothetical protein OXC06_02740 [Acidimicrobiaceae bacterium]|nr:hypothetical protein [Acidimicrobiaceae bacterium]